MIKAKRRMESEEFWAGHQERWQKSGISKQEYAKREGLSKETFYKRSQRLEGGKKIKEGVLDPVFFSKVEAENKSPYELRLRFPNGVILEIPGEMPFSRQAEMLKLWI